MGSLAVATLYADLPAGPTLAFRTLATNPDAQVRARFYVCALGFCCLGAERQPCRFSDFDAMRREVERGAVLRIALPALFQPVARSKTASVYMGLVHSSVAM